MYARAGAIIVTWSNSFLICDWALGYRAHAYVARTPRCHITTYALVVPVAVKSAPFIGFPDVAA